MPSRPRAWTMLVTAAAWTLAVSPALVHAQSVYRIVGPDGRVTYADHPPAAVTPSGRVDVLRGSAGSAASPTAAVTSPAEDPAAARAGPRRGPSATASAPSPDPAIEAAVIGVLGVEDIVKRTESICVATQPSAARRYSGAVDDWARRNTRPVLVARRVLTREFDVEKREQVEAGVRQRNGGLFAGIVDASPEGRAAWCDRSFAEIAAGRMDVHDKPALARPLADLPVR